MFANPLEFDVVLRARSTHVNLVIAAVRRGRVGRGDCRGWLFGNTPQFTTLPGATAGGTCTFQATPTQALFMFRLCFVCCLFFFFLVYLAGLVVASVCCCFSY